MSIKNNRKLLEENLNNGSYKKEECKCSELEGKIFVDIYVTKNKKNIALYSKDELYIFSQDECGNHTEVVVEDICGDLNDLVGTPILSSYSTTDVLDKETDDELTSYTFYHLSTIKGSVTIRWCEVSNGYYSCSVQLHKKV